MGLMRKATSISTLGLVNYRSKKERNVKAAEKTAKAEHRRSVAEEQAAHAEVRRSEAEAELLDAQRRQVEDGADNGSDLVSKLSALDELHSRGTLSDEEYAAAKAKLLT